MPAGSQVFFVGALFGAWEVVSLQLANQWDVHQQLWGNMFPLRPFA